MREDAAAWHADGGPDELADEEGMRGHTATLVIYDEIGCFTDGMAAFGNAVIAGMRTGMQEWAEGVGRTVFPAFTRGADHTAKLIAVAYGFSWAGGELHYHAADAPRRVLRRCRMCHPEALARRRWPSTAGSTGDVRLPRRRQALRTGHPVMTRRAEGRCALNQSQRRKH